MINRNKLTLKSLKQELDLIKSTKSPKKPSESNISPEIKLKNPILKI